MNDMYNQDLKSVREAKKLTQMDLSEISGLPQSHIAKIENGQLLPRKETRVKIERKLGGINWLETASSDREHITVLVHLDLHLDFYFLKHVTARQIGLSKTSPGSSGT